MLTDDELREIEEREAAHQEQHDRMAGLLESCEPNGCGHDSDKIKILAEVKRLRSIIAEHDASVSVVGLAAQECNTLGW